MSEAAAKWLSVSDVARRFSVSPQSVRRWVETGLLPAVRVGPQLLRIREDDVDGFAQPVEVKA